MPPRPRASNAAEPPTAKGQRTRQRLVDAAELIFGDIGFERASIVEITRGAGVALGTFYVYFPTKQAIFTELVSELGHGLRRALAEATAGLRDRLAIERAGCHAFLSYALAHRGLYRIVRQAEFVDPELYREYYRRLAASYTAGLREAMDEGELRRLDAETIAYALMGIFDFIGMRWVIWEGRRPPDRLVDDVFVMLRGGLAPIEADGRATATTSESAARGKGAAAATKPRAAASSTTKAVTKPRPASSSTKAGTKPRPAAASSTKAGTQPRPAASSSSTKAGAKPRPAASSSSTRAGTKPRPAAASSTKAGTKPRPAASSSTRADAKPRPAAASSTEADAKPTRSSTRARRAR